MLNMNAMQMNQSLPVFNLLPLKLDIYTLSFFQIGVANYNFYIFTMMLPSFNRLRHICFVTVTIVVAESIRIALERCRY